MSDAPPDTAPPTHTVEPTGGYALIAGITGLVFLYLGLPMLVRFFGDKANPYDMLWPDGRPVAYVELTGGTMWRDIGTLGSALLLFDEAILFGLAAVNPRVARGVLLGVIVTATIGVLLNLLAAGMQIRAGFHQPLYALIGLVLFVLSLTTAIRILRSK